MLRNELGKVKRNLINTYKYKSRIEGDFAELFTPKNKKVVAFDTSIGSDNLGDSIISQYSKEVLKEIFGDENIDCVPTHYCPSNEQIKNLPAYKYKIVCGTNLMASHYERFSNWKMCEDFYGYRRILTLGVGWGMYCDEISEISKYIYRMILSKNDYHSVRDKYTEVKFHEMGIHNVINTGCPSLWNLSETHCKQITSTKSKEVVTTITDYDQDECADRYMLEELFKHYEIVYFWPQGKADIEYLCKLANPENFVILDNNLESFDLLLRDNRVDYVGTRLHGGIHALNRLKRTIIIALDNRAIEMGKDFNLPIILRDRIQAELCDMIINPFETNIRIPEENINKWKAQFK